MWVPHKRQCRWPTSHQGKCWFALLIGSLCFRRKYFMVAETTVACIQHFWDRNKMAIFWNIFCGKRYFECWSNLFKWNSNGSTDSFQLPLPGPMLLNHVYDAIWRHWAKTIYFWHILTLYWKNYSFWHCSVECVACMFMDLLNNPHHTAIYPAATTMAW